MIRLPLSEWLIVRPTLSALANYLRGIIEIDAEIDAKYPAPRKATIIVSAGNLRQSFPARLRAPSSLYIRRMHECKRHFGTLTARCVGMVLQHRQTRFSGCMPAALKMPSKHLSTWKRC